jgi:uncharacterized protein YqiB (DUF1249 family)
MMAARTRDLFILIFLMYECENNFRKLFQRLNPSKPSQKHSSSFVLSLGL